jgi:hypothetical protein
MVAMAELIGTEKQVKWANDIRNKFFSDRDGVASNQGIRWAFVHTWERHLWNPEIADMTFEEFQIVGGGAVKQLLNETSAKFWIDNRDEATDRLVVKMIESAKVSK